MYYSRVDALRFYAVILVLFSHFFSYKITRHLFIGVAGVDLFFVISGFLITEILFRYKDSDKSMGQSLKKFYIRRSLRIFPIYYLYLIVIAILFWTISKNSLPYAFSYLVNFYQQKNEVPIFFSHLWSLSVEEQFYLFWPLVILITPRKHIAKLIVGVILFAVFSRIFIHGINHKLLTTSCLDAFGLGALFAYLKTYNLEKLKQILSYNVFWILGVVVYFSMVILSVFNLHYIDSIYRLGISFISFYLIGVCIYPRNQNNIIAKKLLDNKKIIYIGQISYGIYIYHLLISYLLDPFLNKILFNIFGSQKNFFKLIYYNSYLIKFPLYTVITIGIAILSFKYIERPIAKFKNRIA